MVEAGKTKEDLKEIGWFCGLRSPEKGEVKVEKEKISSSDEALLIGNSIKRCFCNFSGSYGCPGKESLPYPCLGRNSHS
jgi:hypothetical protein